MFPLYYNVVKHLVLVIQALSIDRCASLFPPPAKALKTEATDLEYIPILSEYDKY